ncbi:hypothetical protein V1514DRAFT_285760 [Lipomyces japonicus]|uniref:uncharacterized protein n=1 Tax=Lipomyces japonicus TaxID=56871 RepID=UPI0034CF5749
MQFASGSPSGHHNGSSSSNTTGRGVEHSHNNRHNHRHHHHHHHHHYLHHHDHDHDHDHHNHDRTRKVRCRSSSLSSLSSASSLRSSSSLISSSSSRADASSVYEAEVLVDDDLIQALHYNDLQHQQQQQQQQTLIDKDDNKSLYATLTNRTTETSRHVRGSSVWALGSPSSSNSAVLRNIDYSEYTYDLGWTAASRIHSRNSSLFQVQHYPILNAANASPNTMFGSPGFASPGFLAAHTVAIAEGQDDAISVLDVSSSSSAVTADDAADDDHEQTRLLTGSEVAAGPSSEPMTITNNDDSTAQLLLTGFVPAMAGSPGSGFMQATTSMDGGRYADTDLASLIDYASPRVAPFPSTAEAEELLYSRMSPKSRVALSKLMNGRNNPAMPRPHRFRPPISQNMGYGAIQRHPFYRATPLQDGHASVATGVVVEPSPTPQPAYARLNQTLTGRDFEANEIGFFESLKAFFLTECFFCFASSTEAEA